MSAKNFPSIRRRLLRWYDKHRRDLSWRQTADPYAIWISETMLQQTQVATVLPYYEKFLRAFPTVDALDRAPLERVLRVWSGLGYYRRAENLKKAARQIMREHNGRVPCDYEKLRGLAGIGDYTAGAVLSIAFGQRRAAVDGNVRRVLGRIFAITAERQWRFTAGALVPRARPGDFNQALMELGAKICAPRVPRCEECPLSADCHANRTQHGSVRLRPGKQVTRTEVLWPLAIVRRRGKLLLRRRDADGLLARLWELPGGEIAAKARPLPFLRNELRPLHLTIDRIKRIGELRHSITYRRIRAPIYLIDCRAGVNLYLPGKHWRWIDPASLSNQAISSMTVKALSLLGS
ncbi:MAG: A/G-specific adenine glycosylase [Deltaproteobacteria bacterium]|nr:A/G-specific adenine glycosylase [Deltaproteobacteria bacterium]